MSKEYTHQKRQYGTRKIRYLSLINYLAENAALIKTYKNRDHEESIYLYDNSAVIVKLEQTRLCLEIVSDTKDQSLIICGDLEKILLSKKQIRSFNQDNAHLPHPSP